MESIKTLVNSLVNNDKAQFAANALHSLVSAAGKINDFTDNEEFSAEDRFYLHEAINIIIASNNGANRCQVAIGKPYSNSIEVSLVDDGESLYAQKYSPLLSAKFLERPLPYYWRDNLGEHIDVFAIKDDCLYVYRRSMTGRTYYAMRVIAINPEAGSVYGYITDPEYLEYDESVEFIYHNEHQEILSRFDLPEATIEKIDELHEMHRLAATDAWYVEFEPIDLNQLAKEVVELLNSAKLAVS